MFDVKKLRKIKPFTVCIGSYPTIIQSILDFDYYSGRAEPSVIAIIAAGRKFERYFFGKREILIPVYPSVDKLPEKKRMLTNFILNVTSGRRAFSSTVEALDALPAVIGGAVFAENVPEKHALDLKSYANSKGVFLVGPASVGLLIPKVAKIGAIGGVEHKQLIDAHLFEKGSVAVFSASGGTTNELINIAVRNGKRLSFALHFGGDRYPMVTPEEAFIAAENDPETLSIVYFGELGGIDEYAICELIQTGKLTKPVYAYVAGTVAEIFPTPPQFGHAKAMASTQKETARAKRDALKAAGVNVAESFTEFVEFIKNIPHEQNSEENNIIESMDDRRHALIASSISKDEDGKVKVLGDDLLELSKNHSFAYITASMLLGHKIKSKELEEFVDFILRLLVDHGPYMSGAVNTIVTARAGRDLVSSLSAGLLTIGPRFGGAINEAAGNWLRGVQEGKSASDFVEEFARQKKYISGIGHRKYRSDLPDPRVAEILSYSEGLTARFSGFAKEVEKATLSKKGNLILNVDGAIACVLLDILSEKEGLTDDELKDLMDIEFFNALFVLSRSVGFVSHFLDQKRLDEGIFRLEEEHVADASR